MIKFLIKYKGVILFMLVFIVMLSMYSTRIAELREAEQQTNIAYYEK